MIIRTFGGDVKELKTITNIYTDIDHMLYVETSPGEIYQLNISIESPDGRTSGSTYLSHCTIEEENADE